MKHAIKMLMRATWARLLYHTGLHAIVGSLGQRRLLILTGHCVEHPSNAFLPADMKISADKLGRLLDWFGERYDLVTVAEGCKRLQEGPGRSMIALTMDDGYRDNRVALLPMLRERGIPATVYLESRPLTERRLNWTHKFFWVLGRVGATELVERYAAASADPAAVERLRQVLAGGGDLAYELKKVLKYEADQEDCEATLTAALEDLGGDEQGLCEELYLSPDDARELTAGGVELGGHTVHHRVLSGLDAAAQEREVREGRAALQRELGLDPRSFAYPYGRSWDWNEDSRAAVLGAGFENAATTHAGVNIAGTDPTRLARWMIDETSEFHLLVAEACGGFELLRRFGLDLSE